MEQARQDFSRWTNFRVGLVALAVVCTGALAVIGFFRH
jgi:hypothetical protein